MTGLETLARAITYGAVRGYLDALRDAQLATVEKPTDEDLRRADAIRAAVAKRLRDQASGQARSYDPTPDQPASDRVGVVPPAGR